MASCVDTDVVVLDSKEDVVDVEECCEGQGLPEDVVAESYD